MPLPQVAWQHNYLCKKSKEKVNDGLKTHTYTNNQSDCSQLSVQKINVFIYSCKRSMCIF